MKRIDITDGIQQALDAIDAARAAYRSGKDSYAVVELPKLALADAVLEAIATHRTARLATLPARASRTVAVRPTPRRRRA